MFKKRNTYSPEKIYIDINFESVKNDLKQIYDNYDDFGSLMRINFDQYMITVNRMGEIKFLYNDLNEMKVRKNLRNIEQAFQKDIPIFEVDFNH